MTIAASLGSNASAPTSVGAGPRIAIFADGANLNQMLATYNADIVDGFTTNPTLMAKAGVTNYEAFARGVLEVIRDLPISFEVFADDLAGMEAQARKLGSWGDNVFVKIPVSNTAGESTLGLVRELSAEGLKINVTAVMTLEQVSEIVDAVDADTPAICSIFAGRIADTGRDPMPLMREAVQMCAAKPQLRVLWASPREVLNVYQADQCGCHIIAATPDLISKLSLKGKDLAEFSRETVEMFFRDANSAGLTL
jgi:transaldolase